MQVWSGEGVFVWISMLLFLSTINSIFYCPKPHICQSQSLTECMNISLMVPLEVKMWLPCSVSIQANQTLQEFLCYYGFTIIFLIQMTWNNNFSSMFFFFFNFSLSTLECFHPSRKIPDLLDSFIPLHFFFF